MTYLTELIRKFSDFIPILRSIISVIILYTIFSIILRVVKKNLLRKAKTKKQISNIKIFSKVIKYIILLFLLIFGIFSYSGSWTGLGITLGLFSAALGFALQKPITGIAAWIMVVTKRPFGIGDRILMGGVKGDVTDITITHICLNEVGGIVPSEENSGRIILIPNSTLFEQNIINYTLQHPYVLDQVCVTVTYNSNLNKAIEVAINSAKKFTKEFIKDTKKDPYVRVFFQPYGIDVRVRYTVPTTKLAEICSNITKELFERVMQEKDIEIAYPTQTVHLSK